MKYVLILAGVLLVGATGCATIFSGTSQTIDIDSQPQGARILIDGIDYGRTPETITVKKPGFSDKRVTLRLDGYEDRTFILQKEFDTVSVLNIFSGLLGWVVDIATGAIMKYDQTSYNLELERDRTAFRMEHLDRNAEGHYLVPDVATDVVLVDERTGVSLLFKKQK